jgi:DNA repair exonuclease SbcCD ATPase subunit
MPATAKKKTPPVVIAGGRDELARAIELEAEAERRVEAKREAVSRAREAIEKAEERLEAARAGIDKAKEHDVRRAAAGIASKRGSPATSSLTEKAMEELAEAERSLEVSIAARATLEQNLTEAEDDAADCSSDVLVAIKSVTVPTIERLIAEVDAGKRRLAVAENVLGLLVASQTGPSFHSFLRARKAEDRRDAPLAELKKAAQRLQFGNNAASYFDDAKAALAAWSTVLAALRHDPSCRLPGED